MTCFSLGNVITFSDRNVKSGLDKAGKMYELKPRVWLLTLSKLGYYTGLIFLRVRLSKYRTAVNTGEED